MSPKVISAKEIIWVRTKPPSIRAVEDAAFSIGCLLFGDHHISDRGRKSAKRFSL